MIIKRVWSMRRRRRGMTKFDVDFTIQPHEGWYLFGILPIYIRASGPERHTATGKEYHHR